MIIQLIRIDNMDKYLVYIELDMLSVIKEFIYTQKYTMLIESLMVHKVFLNLLMFIRNIIVKNSCPNMIVWAHEIYGRDIR